MKRITKRSVALAITLVLAFATLATSAPKSEGARKQLKIEGRVLQINKEARTLLVADRWSDKLYLVSVPKDETLKITFGLKMNLAEANFRDVNQDDRVRVRCIRSQEHLARLDDGRQVTVLAVAH